MLLSAIEISYMKTTYIKNNKLRCELNPLIPDAH